ncbi:denticleless protein homolog B isoform X1 [Aphis gossypii]|uniref:denticleless protein homolog B isoform X1 n=1 Tax=Aphis gossypii TaxID=80765 RepID=UPI0021591329|nr:denticleless protein homolog B isoform X1 [Aphis gossypii]
MDTVNVFNFIKRRQLGYAAPNYKIYDMYLDKIGYKHPRMDNTHNINIDTGNTFACKFSRNKNNLHIVGCATEIGDIIIENTHGHYVKQNNQFQRNSLHSNAIFNISWAEPQMKLVTGCGDQTSKLCTLRPSGELHEEQEFFYSASVRSVMFCPGSSDIFCGGCQDGSIKVWDSRLNKGQKVLDCEIFIPNTHGCYKTISKTKKIKIYGVNTLIYRNDQTIISGSSLDHALKVWDLRKSYRQVRGSTEPLPVTKYYCGDINSPRFNGFTDIILNPESTKMYASCVTNTIYCYSLDSADKLPICEFSGHAHETSYSKISISPDGKYLFSGCMNNSGLLWKTDFPYQSTPMFKIKSNRLFTKLEMSSSDWCLDSRSPKLVTSGDTMPMVWSVLSDEERESTDPTICRTEFHALRPFSTKISTVPNDFKFETELREKYKKETEVMMENWDIPNQNVGSIEEHLNVTPKKNPWNVLFSTKTTSPSSVSSQSEITSKDSTLVVSNQIPEAVTPTSSKKRKKSIVSPKSLIDQYLVPNRKREKLDTVNEV